MAASRYGPRISPLLATKLPASSCARWQFCIEREFKHIRTKCGNKNQIEACIDEAYIIEEVSDDRTMYYPDDVPTLHNKLSRYNEDEPNYKPKLLLFQGQGGKSGGQRTYTVIMQE